MSGARKGGLTEAVADGDSLAVSKIDAAALADLEAMRQLRGSLDALPLAPDEQMPLSFRRADAIAVLRCLVEVLKRPLSKPLEGDPLEDGTRVLMEHPAVSVVDRLADALGDLDKAKTHEALKPSSVGSGRSHPAQEWHMRDALLELVEVIQKSKGLRTRKQAEQALAKMIKDVSANELSEWRKTRRRTDR